MTTLELLQNTFPTASFIERFSVLQHWLFIISVSLTSMFGYYVYHVIRTRLKEKDDLAELPVSKATYRRYFVFPINPHHLFLIGGLGFVATFCMFGIVSSNSYPTSATLITMSKILDSNFTVTPKDYYKGEFLAFTISTPATTAQLKVLDKVVLTQIPVLSFTISARNLKKLEHAVKDQPQLLSKLIATK